MNRITSRWLVLLAAGLLAFIVFYERRRPGTEEQAEQAALVLPEFKPAEVTALELVRGSNQTIRVERWNDSWRLRLPVVYPAQPEGPEKVLSALATLRWRSFLSAKEVIGQTNGLAAFGLEPPSLSLLLSAGGQRTELRFGSPTLLNRQVYLQVVGRDGLYAVDTDWLKAFPSSIHAWRDRGIANLAHLEFNRVEVRPATNGFEVVRNPTNRLWQMTKPLQTRANNERVEFLLNQLQWARVSRFVTDDPKSELERFGLLPPERELVLGQGTNDLFVLQVGRSPADDPAQIYVRSLAFSNVLLAPRQALEPWLANFREFCDRRLMVFRVEQVDRIEVRAAEGFALQRDTNSQWRIVEPFAAAADPALVMEMLANLAELEFLEFEKEVVTDFSGYGLAPPRRQYILKTAVPANPPAGPTNLVLAQVDFGQPSGHKIFARRSSESSVVTTIDNGRLPQWAFQLRDRRIWNISTNQIAALTIQHNGRTRKVLRRGPAQWTPAAESGGIVNPLSLEEAAYRLGQLRAEVWVATGEDKLAYYGISAAQHSIAVELLPTEPPQTLTLRLGRLAPSRRPYAATQLEGVPGPVIFECPLALYDFVLSDLSNPSAPPGTP